VNAARFWLTRMHWQQIVLSPFHVESDINCRAELKSALRKWMSWAEEKEEESYRFTPEQELEYKLISVLSPQKPILISFPKSGNNVEVLDMHGRSIYDYIPRKICRISSITLTGFPQRLFIRMHPDHGPSALIHNCIFRFHGRCQHGGD
jgi:hypothetical protein